VRNLERKYRRLENNTPITLFWSLMRKSILDDEVAMAKIDRENMLRILEQTPEAYGQAYKSATDSGSLPPPISSPPSFLALVGMGGSAIGADILKEWFLGAQTSIEVIRGPELPGSVGAGTFVLFASYSGRTAETLKALSEARKRNAQISCIASGGELLDICQKEGIPHVQVTAGLQPREALPHLLCSSLVILERWAVCDHEAIKSELSILKDHLQELGKKIGFERTLTRNPAKKLALQLQRTIPFIYTSQHLAPAGRRFKNQLNENAKVLAKFEALPEMLHNEVQGWHMLKEGFADSISFVLLRGREDESEAKQFRELKRLVRQRGGKKVHEISLTSPTTPVAILKTIHYCDFVSFYLSVARGIDPTPVRTIQSLKRLTRPT
jgi:glucose/mannose-6-phosphate isomerase